MNIVEQNEVLEITRLLYSLPDVDLCNALENINELYNTLGNLKRVKTENKIILSEPAGVQ